MKKTAAILLILALLLTGCSENTNPLPTGDPLLQSGASNAATTPDTEQAFSLVYYPDRSMNPYHSTDVTNRTLFSLIYQGLFSVNREYEAEPVLCDRYAVTADLKTYTFYLAQAMFSDGSRVTAGDVVASLNAAQESRWYGGRLQQVKSVSVSGEAVVIELKR